MPSFTVKTSARCSCHAMFEAALSPELHAASMARHHEEARVAEAMLGLHDEVSFTARHFGRTWHMTSRIIDLIPNRSFVDEQTMGPFKQFRHTHTFVTVEEGCEMTDHVTYQAPAGIVGTLAEHLILTRYLRNLITQRGHYLANIAGD